MKSEVLCNFHCLAHALLKRYLWLVHIPRGPKTMHPSVFSRLLPTGIGRAMLTLLCLLPLCHETVIVWFYCHCGFTLVGYLTDTLLFRQCKSKWYYLWTLCSYAYISVRVWIKCPWLNGLSSHPVQSNSLIRVPRGVLRAKLCISSLFWEILPISINLA